MTEVQLHQKRLEEFLAGSRPYPVNQFNGRGIVICAGGVRYFTNGYICASILRRHGCQLPIQFWHLNEAEMTDEMRQIAETLGVTTVNASDVRKRHPSRILNGWEVKPYAIIHSPFREVLSLDADNVPVRDPQFLFESEQYRKNGAIFWPDYGRLGPTHPIWDIVGIDYRDEPEFESGQVVVDKERCWNALNLAMFFNEWSDFYYRHVLGDKETFHLAWRKLGQAYAMPKKGVASLDGCTMLQYDFDGTLLFQHRNLRKWSLTGDNKPVRDFAFEAECFSALEELRDKWSIFTPRQMTGDERKLFNQVIHQRSYLYIRVGHDYRELELTYDGLIAKGAARLERNWHVSTVQGTAVLRIGTGDECICELKSDGDGVLRGQWLRYEKMPIRLVPLR